MQAPSRCVLSLSSRRFGALMTRPFVLRVPLATAVLPRVPTLLDSAAAAAPPPVTVAGARPRGISTQTHVEPLVGNPAPEFEADAYMPSGKQQRE